ncbi:DUF6266 family protein [Pedobacter gandavensis]|uniref:DUF6266 family protein n=1 Tax=Pedobacter gandavensis TaxID=2679963 RepID=UPI00292E061C|nr:DUF6266 family protein [Pedobacter gandavensis]
MAKALNGPQGHFNGKIGKLVFYMLNGVPVVRLIGRPGKPSKAQLANHSTMSVTSRFLGTMKDFIKLGYGLQAKGTTRNAHNLATSYHKKHALIGEYPNIKIDYSKVVLSEGTLSVAEDLKIVKTEAGLEISWNPDFQQGKRNYDDSVMIMVHFPESNTSRDYLNIARRSEGKCFLGFMEQQLEQQMEVYIAFRSADGEQISDSVYLGNLNGQKPTKEELHNQYKYESVKERFDRVAKMYLDQCKGTNSEPTNNKAFRHLQKEYEVLKEKLDRTPGKPG